MQTKICAKCNQEKPKNSEYFRFRNTKNSSKKIFRSECRKCEIERMKEWRKTKPEQAKLQSINYRIKTKDSEIHLKKRLLKDAKIRAKRKQIEFSISADDLYLGEKCPVLSIPLKSSDKICSSNSPTIDRKNNTKGYTKDNVEIISFRANTIKGNATAEEIFKVALYAERCEGKGNRFTRWLKSLVFKYL